MAEEKKPTFIALQIKRRRQELGMSQSTLARLLAYADRSSVSWIESGRKRVKPDELKRIAEALQTTPEQLAGPDAEPDSLTQYLLTLWRLVPEKDRALAAQCVSGVLQAFTQRRFATDYIIAHGDPKDEK